MHESSYDLDPCGDIILVLNNPNQAFAGWEEDEWSLSTVSTEPSRLQTQMAIHNGDGVPTFSFRDVDPAIYRSAKNRRKPRVEPLVDSDNFVAPPQDDVVEPLDNGAVETQVVEPASTKEGGLDEAAQEVRMRLSSRHLILASAWFKRELDGPYSNGPSSSRPDAPRTVQAYDWDVEAVLVLMKAIHGRHRTVPKSVSLEFLAKLAVLVDHYQCHEVIELYSDMWALQIEKDQMHHQQSEGDIWLQILVSGVFARSEMFKTVTRSAIMCSRGQRYMVNVPFPNGLHERIEDQRQKIINRLNSLIYDLSGYLSTRSDCSRLCSDTLLGTLTRELRTHDLLYSLPTRLFHGHSISNLVQTVRAFQSPSRQWGYEGGACSCMLESFLSPKISELEASIEGLNLGDFKRPEPVIPS